VPGAIFLQADGSSTTTKNEKNSINRQRIRSGIIGAVCLQAEFCRVTFSSLYNRLAAATSNYSWCNVVFKASGDSLPNIQNLELKINHFGTL